VISMIFTSCQGAPDLIGNGRQEPPATSSCVKVRLFGKSDMLPTPRSTAPLAGLYSRICRGRRPKFMSPRENTPFFSLVYPIWRRTLHRALEDAQDDRRLGFILFSKWASTHPLTAGPRAVAWAWARLAPSATTSPSTNQLRPWDAHNRGEGGQVLPPSPTREA